MGVTAGPMPHPDYERVIVSSGPSSTFLDNYWVNEALRAKMAPKRHCNGCGAPKTTHQCEYCGRQE